MINIEQSETLRSTHIINNTDSEKIYKQDFCLFHWGRLSIVFFSLALVFLFVFVGLPSIKSGDTLGQHTSYVLEINPQICITTNQEDKVVSVVSLNNDGDLVLSDEFFDSVGEGDISLTECLDRIILFIYNENPDKFVFGKGIKLYVVNDIESVARDKMSKTKQYISSKLEQLGKLEITIEEYFMSNKDFGDKMGFDSFGGLDKMIEDIKGKDKFFNPNRNPISSPNDKPNGPSHKNEDEPKNNEKDKRK